MTTIKKQCVLVKFFFFSAIKFYFKIIFEALMQCAITDHGIKKNHYLALKCKYAFENIALMKALFRTVALHLEYNMYIFYSFINTSCILHNSSFVN